MSPLFGSCFVLFLASSSALASSSVEPRTLASVPVPDSLSAVPFPVHAHLRGADGSEYALVFAPAERLALHSGARSLARAGSAQEFVVARERRTGARQKAPAIVDVLLDDGLHVVARASAEQAEALSAEGFDLQRLPEKPMTLSRPASSALPGPTAYDPDVAALVAQVTQEALYDLDGSLSGTHPVTIGGSPYTIQTRHTGSGTPIQMATQFASEGFLSSGLASSFQSWQSDGATGRNVIAELPGASRPTEIVIVCGHIDDMPSGSTAPGADDNASGAAGVLLAARILGTHRFERTIRFVLFTGEEQGLFGSAAYASLLASQQANVVAVLNLDMIAWNSSGAPTLRLHTRTTKSSGYAGDRSISDTFQSSVTNYLGSALTPVETPDGETASDHSSFWDQGWPAILAIEDDLDDFTPYYHTTKDTLSTLNMTYFTSFVKAAVATTAHLALPASSGGTCTADSTTLCLLGGRFRVKAEYADYGGGRGQAHAAGLTGDTGTFWFFNSANVEVIAKMVSFCGGGTNNVAVYAAGLTDLDVTLHVTDTRTETTRDYRNLLGTGFTPIRDGPFACPAAASRSGEELLGRTRTARTGTEIVKTTSWAEVPPSPTATCAPDATTLCLSNGRFRVQAAYRDYGGGAGAGQALPLSSDTGAFWFFNAANVEVVAKMVSFCGGGTNNVAIYAGGLTDVGVTTTVTDVQTGLTKTYTNALGELFQLVRDGPFACQ